MNVNKVGAALLQIGRIPLRTIDEAEALEFIREYRITEVNDAMCKTSGFSREEMIGKSPLQFSPESYNDF